MIDVRLVELATGAEVRFWPAPARLPREDAATTRTFRPIRGGERQRPDGRRARRWTLQHTFVGPSALGSAFAPAEAWADPAAIDRTLRGWEDADPPAALVLSAGALAADGSPAGWPGLHEPVYLDGYRPTWGAGDDLDAELVLVELRPLLIAVDESAASPTGGPSSTASPVPTAGIKLPPGTSEADVPYDRWVVRAGDTLPSIAANSHVYGDATQARRLFDCNKDTSGTAPDTSTDVPRPRRNTTAGGIEGYTAMDQPLQVGWVLAICRTTPL